MHAPLSARPCLVALFTPTPGFGPGASGGGGKDAFDSALCRSVFSHHMLRRLRATPLLRDADDHGLNALAGAVRAVATPLPNMSSRPSSDGHLPH